MPKMSFKKTVESGILGYKQKEATQIRYSTKWMSEVQKKNLRDPQTSVGSVKVVKMTTLSLGLCDFCFVWHIQVMAYL